MFLQIEDHFLEDLFGILRYSRLAVERILIDVRVLSFEIDAKEVGNASLGSFGTEIDGLVVLSCREDELVGLVYVHVK